MLYIKLIPLEGITLDKINKVDIVIDMMQNQINYLNDTIHKTRKMVHVDVKHLRAEIKILEKIINFAKSL